MKKCYALNRGIIYMYNRASVMCETQRQNRASAKGNVMPTALFIIKTNK